MIASAGWLVHGEWPYKNAMIYLSDKGEVLGEFEESAVADMLATKKISNAAFFWREGMGEWRPISELSISPAKKPEPKLQPAPVVAAAKPAAVVVAPVNPAAAAKGASKPFVPRRGPAPARVEVKPEGSPQPMPMRSANDIAPAPASGGKSRRALVWLVLLVLLLAAAGGGGWWWINREPPLIPGTVALSGTETSPVEVRVFRREDLSGPWRERLTAADARAAELDNLLAETEKQVREKSLLYEEASRVLEVGEEYNMPDVAELRADRDAKQADASSAKAEYDKLKAEKDSLPSLDGLLSGLPAPLKSITADGQGNFALPPDESEVVLLATVTSATGDQQAVSAWLEVVELAEDGAAPEAVRFSETNRLDVAAIRSFAEAASP